MSQWVRVMSQNIYPEKKNIVILTLTLKLTPTLTLILTLGEKPLSDSKPDSWLID